jgi:hypothetical protein
MPPTSLRTSSCLRTTSKIGAVRFMLAIVTCFMLAACANHQSARLLRDADDLSGSSRYYVARFQPDERGINRLIRDDIATRGYEVTTGPEAMMPPDTDVLVTYWDKWMWDITMYMIELDITLHDADTGDPLAVGNSMHASLTRLSPEEMIKEVLDNIFAEMNAQVAQRWSSGRWFLG